MFSTLAQQATVCERLCAIVGQPGLWTTGRDPRPTKRALDLFEGGTLSHGEHLMVRAAFDVWNGRGKMPLGEALATLDGRCLEALGSLLLALGHPLGSLAIDAWLGAHR